MLYRKRAAEQSFEEQTTSRFRYSDLKEALGLAGQLLVGY